MEHPSGRFGKLTIRGFRRLLDVSLELRPLSVLIGANGVGKTSVLDVLTLLANSAQGRLSTTISDLSGLSNLITYDRAEVLGLGITMDVPKHDPLDYKLLIKPQGVGYYCEELLSQQRKGFSAPFIHISSSPLAIKYYDSGTTKLASPTWEHNSLETSLAQVPKMFREPEEFRRKLASSTCYHALNVEPRSRVRLPQSMGPTELPGRDGEDLVSCLFYLRETNRDRFEAIEDSLRVAFPRFSRLEFPPVAAGTLALAWREKGATKPFYAHQLSEGTLRFLWLTALLQSPGLTALTLLDEPEVSLHPELLSLLADQLREASHRSQIVVATHSDALVRALEPKEVVVCDSDEEGMTVLTRAEELDLDDWLKEYSLDELWRNGRLGARA